jgi:hypothetical protein
MGVMQSNRHRWTLVATAIAVAALAATPTAHAGFQVSMSTSGLNVATDQPDKSDVLQITGRLSPENTISNWDVDPLCLIGFIIDPFATGCVDEHDPNCNALDGGTRRIIRCARVAARVTISTQGGDDRIRVGTAGTDPVTIDAGAGNDDVSSASLFSDVPVEPSSGTWDANLGPGNDVYLGSQGFDGVSAGPGNDTIFAGPESEHQQSDAYDGGSGFDTLDYSARTTGIFAAVIGATGGAPGEQDGIANFERVVGGSGNDSNRHRGRRAGHLPAGGRADLLRAPHRRPRRPRRPRRVDAGAGALLGAQGIHRAGACGARCGRDRARAPVGPADRGPDLVRARAPRCGDGDPPGEGPRLIRSCGACAWPAPAWPAPASRPRRASRAPTWAARCAARRAPW